MDKNTVTGLFLMAAVLFGFMWLNSPSEEQLAREREQLEQQQREEEALSSNQNLLSVDSVSASEVAVLCNTISRFGKTDSISGITTLKAPDAELTLSSEGKPGGFVTTPYGAVEVSDIITCNYAGISQQKAQAAVAGLRKALADVAKYKGFAKYLSGDSTTVKLANKLLTLEISNKGGAIARASLNDYKRYDSAQVELIAPGLDLMSFTLTSATQRFETHNFYFTPVEVSDSTVLMQLELGDGAKFGLRYTLRPDSYLVDIDVEQQGMQTVIPTSVATIDFTWNSTLLRNEAGRMFEERNSALYYMYANGDVDNLSESKKDDKEISQRLKWIGYKNQFFSSVLVARSNFASAYITSTPVEDSRNQLKSMTTSATLDYSSDLASPAAFTLFLGPNSYPLLDDLEDNISPETNLHLTKLIPLGWPIVRWINTWIVIPVFDILGKWISNYGIIILLLTIFIKIILFPFTYKSYMSQAKMRVLAPEIKEINEKYPGNENALKRQQETMALYSRAGASPFSGCLPMLLQFPILIAMFNFFPSAIELRGESFLWAKDLSAPDAIVSWTTNIPLISSTFGNHISLFCVLMTVTNIIYTRYTMQSQPGGNSMPGMKMMMYLMPLMFLVFFNNYAAGLSYYYFLSLLITIIQFYVFRKVVSEEKVRARMAENAKKPKKKSGFMARLEEAQRQQQAMLREQQKRQQKSNSKGRH